MSEKKSKTDATTKAAAKKRSYPAKDVKLLWGLSAGKCAFPECREKCAVKETESDPAAVIGQIAHIEAHSERGPRANPNLTAKERDCYQNWILLCPTHHTLVDKQENSFTVEELRQWKVDHEQWVNISLAQKMPAVGFAELETITQALINNPGKYDEDYTVIAPTEKIAKNNLSANSHFLLSTGLSKAGEVRHFIEEMTLIDGSFPDRLRTRFILEYKKLKKEGHSGDYTLEHLRQLTAPSTSPFAEQAAGLAVLSYFFESCDIFQ